MRFPAKITSSCIWVAIPVDWVILHWYACGVDGRAYGHVITKISRMGRLPHFLRLGLSSRALRARLKLRYNKMFFFWLKYGRQANTDTFYCSPEFSTSDLVLTGLDCTRSIFVFLKVEHSRRFFRANRTRSRVRTLSIGQNWSYWKKDISLFLYHCRAYHLEIKWSGWKVLINSGILLKTGLVWPGSSDKCGKRLDTKKL